MFFLLIQNSDDDDDDDRMKILIQLNWILRKKSFSMVILIDRSLHANTKYKLNGN